MPRRSSASARRRWRHLRDRDVRCAALVSLLALLLSGGLVWLGYLVHVCRVAARSPRVPPQRMIALVFGRRLEHGAPARDYRLRLRRALRLVRLHHAEHLLLLGGPTAGAPSEAAAGHAWLLQHGLAATVRVELEQYSTDSLENLRQARRLLLAQAGTAGLPPVALVSSRYHLARCLLLAHRLGLRAQPVAAEPTLPLHHRYLGRLLLEASYVMWIDLGLRWAALIGHRRMIARIG